MFDSARYGNHKSVSAAYSPIRSRSLLFGGTKNPTNVLFSRPSGSSSMSRSTNSPSNP